MMSCGILEVGEVGERGEGENTKRARIRK